MLPQSQGRVARTPIKKNNFMSISSPLMNEACEDVCMSVIRSINLAAAFLLELCMLAALGYWGFTAVSGWPRIALGLAAPLLAAVVWGIFLAPRASRPLDASLTFWLKGALLGLGAAAPAAAGRQWLAAVFALAVELNLVLLWLWRECLRPRPG
jgi:hypothetical protein